MFSGWGLNPNFEIPEALQDYVFHFESTPSRHQVVPVAEAYF